MKYIIWILAPIIGAFIITGCEDNDNVTHSGNQLADNAFAEKYPGASGIDWEREGAYLVVDFRKNFTEMEAWFDQDGQWFLTVTDVPFKALPEAVKTAFSTSEYQSWRIEDVDMIERQGMEIVYVLETEKGNSEYDLYYSPDGTLIKTVADSYDDDYNKKYIPPMLSEKIMNYISANYPQARVLETETEKGIIEADIIDGNIHKELFFNTDGEWVCTKTRVGKNTVPQTVMNAFNTSEYGSYVIDSVYYLETPQRNYYYFEAESFSREVELIITLDGTIEVVKIDRD